jgi:beta-N-acetylhexosaminidase
MAADPEIPTTVAQPSASSTELTTTTVATIAPPTSEDVVAGAVAALDRRHKLAQMLWVGFNTGYGGEAGSSTDGDAQAVLDLGVGGVFIGRKEVGLFTGDVLGAASRAPIPLLVATDGEGGRVDIWSDLADPLPPAEQMANESDPAIEAMAKAHGAELRSLGVNVNFAPMLDVRGGPNPLGDRTWSDDPNLVTDKAGAFAEGMCTAGVYPTFKHFPGHGRSDYDADLRPATTPSIDELRSFDLTPWRDLLPKMENRSLVMTGHLDVPGLTNGLPLSLDAKAMRLLRDELGYNGVAVTDELAEMGAITDRGISVPSAVEQSLIAGNDMALFFGDVGSASHVLDRLETAMDEGRLTEAQVDESVTRIMRLKLTGGCPTPA